MLPAPKRSQSASDPTSQGVVHNPLAGPPPANIPEPGRAQVRPWLPQSALLVHAAPRWLCVDAASRAPAPDPPPEPPLLPANPPVDPALPAAPALPPDPWPPSSPAHDAIKQPVAPSTNTAARIPVNLMASP